MKKYNIRKILNTYSYELASGFHNSTEGVGGYYLQN